MEIVWVTTLATVVNRQDTDAGKGTPELRCSIEPGVAATMPYAAIEISGGETYRPTIEHSDGTVESFILTTMDIDELNDMADAAPTMRELAAKAEASPAEQSNGRPC